MERERKTERDFGGTVEGRQEDLGDADQDEKWEVAWAALTCPGVEDAHSAAHTAGPRALLAKQYSPSVCSAVPWVGRQNAEPALSSSGSSVLWEGEATCQAESL